MVIGYSLRLLDLHQIGVLWIALRQRRRTVRGQGVHAGTVVNAVTLHIGLMPRPLAHGADARHDPRGHFGGNAHFAAGVEDPHHVAVFNAAFLRINRVEPHFLAAGGLQHVHIAVAGVGAGFVVKAESWSGN